MNIYKGEVPASRFRFKVCVPAGCIAWYNFYHGQSKNKLDYWVTDDDSTNIPPGWHEEIISADDYYPTDMNDTTLRTEGGNILIYEVTGADGITTKRYTIYIDRKK